MIKKYLLFLVLYYTIMILYSFMIKTHQKEENNNYILLYQCKNNCNKIYYYQLKSICKNLQPNNNYNSCINKLSIKTKLCYKICEELQKNNN